MAAEESIDGMFDKIEYLVHVTRRTRDTVTEENVIQEYGSYLEARHAHPHPLGSYYDTLYDGVLATPKATAYRDEDFPPPGVYLSATLFQGDLPTKSPYPTDGVEGKEYWSIAVPIQQCNLDNCSVFRVTTNDQKVLLAFVPNVDQDKISWFKERTEEIDPGNNQYMYFKESWYCRKHQGGKWTKVFLPFDVDIRNARWSPMQKIGEIGQ